MNAQKLFVHDRGERQRAERLEARFVYAFRVLVLALDLEREVIGQVPALVVSTEEEERVGVPDLEGPQIEHTLQARVPEMSRIVKERA
jgi:hypothetical protein